MRTLIIGFLLLALGGLPEVGSAAIVERVIYAGPTPLASTCRVTQTGPMELTVAPCTFTTTGWARIFGALKSLVARSGVGELARAVAEGKAEWTSDGLRIRGWLRDKQGNIIEKKATWRLPVAESVTVTPGNTYFIYLVKKVGVTMEIKLLPVNDPVPTNYVHYLALDFTVPLGTTDLNTVKIEVYTVRPGPRPAKGLFEK